MFYSTKKFKFKDVIKFCYIMQFHSESDPDLPGPQGKNGVFQHETVMLTCMASPVSKHDVVRPTGYHGYHQTDLATGRVVMELRHCVLPNQAHSRHTSHFGPLLPPDMTPATTTHDSHFLHHLSLISDLSLGPISS